MAEKAGEELVVKDGLKFRRTDIGLVFVPDFRVAGRKHHCPDCAECAICADARCEMCRKEREEKDAG
ncbi:MAG: hypothetical protein HZB23_05035 [Deltaproteobacteria bacterium]|nr:hypothetical protein [Deltaproteobacteria bacterium]